MKKFILSILLLTIFTIPAMAKLPMDFIAKAGLLASPYLNMDKNISIPDKNFNDNILDVDLGFTAGAEIFIYPWEKIGLGIGAFHLFNTDIENTAQKISATNAYLAAKPKIVFKDSEIDSLYFIGQVGVSKADIKLIDADNLTGVYLAGGIGIEVSYLIAEVLYSYYNWMIPDNQYASHGSMYSLQLNLGFKYSI